MKPIQPKLPTQAQGNPKYEVIPHCHTCESILLDLADGCDCVELGYECGDCGACPPTSDCREGRCS